MAAMTSRTNQEYESLTFFAFSINSMQASTFILLGVRVAVITRASLKVLGKMIQVLSSALIRKAYTTS